MALRDFKQYLNTIQRQELEMKATLAEYDKLVRDGTITEDRLTDIRNDIHDIETNYQRLLYVAYLLELPNRKDKKAKYKVINAALEEAFNNMDASEAMVLLENKSSLDNIRKELKELKKQTSK